MHVYYLRTSFNRELPMQKADSWNDTQSLSSCFPISLIATKQELEAALLLSIFVIALHSLSESHLFLLHTLSQLPSIVESWLSGTINPQLRKLSLPSIVWLYMYHDIYYILQLLNIFVGQVHISLISHGIVNWSFPSCPYASGRSLLNRYPFSLLGIPITKNWEYEIRTELNWSNKL